MTEIVATANKAANSVLNSARMLIVGRRGRLARALRYTFPRAQAMGREAIDITDDASVKRAVAKATPAIVVNCAAITDLSLCERDPVATRRVNVDGVAYLAAATKAAGALLVQISSDYAADPINEYGRSKRDSEAFGDIAIRAKIYDGSHWAWRALREGRRIRMTTCEFCNPISVTGLAALLPLLLQQGVRGVTNLGTTKRVSNFEVGQTWSDVLAVSRELVEPAGQLNSPYRRPADTYMPVDALNDAGVCIPSLKADATSHRDHYTIYGGHD